MREGKWPRSRASKLACPAPRPGLPNPSTRVGPAIAACPGRDAVAPAGPAGFRPAEKGPLVAITVRGGAIRHLPDSARIRWKKPACASIKTRAPAGVVLIDFSAALADSVLRMMRFLDRPRALPTLAPMIKQEICYWLLAGSGRQNREPAPGK
ncbi:AraC family transcriptional regulator N-terminal domain-containing protein [Arboricoccus pini]|uniref:AraC family transcriptional regulator N-terminal domain-containing protein n=1 Tax=Arboricoccus pini TaxID=1963835 RepID=UPI003898F0E6